MTHSPQKSDLAETTIASFLERCFREHTKTTAFLGKDRNTGRWTWHRVGFDTASDASWTLAEAEACKLIDTLKRDPSFFEIHPDSFVNLREIVAIDHWGENDEKFAIFFNWYPGDEREPAGLHGHCLILTSPEARHVLAALKALLDHDAPE